MRAHSGVYCTEPFRIPFAGKIDICAFDKTGTLTSDNLVVEGVAGVAPDGSSALTPLSDLPPETVHVLASCHSLVRLDVPGGEEDSLLGDPLEKVCLAAVEWTLTKNDTVIPPRGGSKMLPLKIAQRYHFSSALKRMSVVASYLKPGSSEPLWVATVKGAPEVLKERFRTVPPNYDQVLLERRQEGERFELSSF